MSKLRKKVNAKMVLVAEVMVLEIINRAKSGGEITSFLESSETVREEAVRRGCKAGICNSEGGPVRSGKIISMPSNEQYRKNYRCIFGHD